VVDPAPRLDSLRRTVELDRDRLVEEALGQAGSVVEEVEADLDWGGEGQASAGILPVPQLS
jgi:hypothetical protein